MTPFHRPGAMAHQLVAFERFKNEPIIALFFDPRTRKTSTTLAIWRYRVERGDVDALVVVAADLGGVKWVWRDEALKELPPEFLKQLKILVWDKRTGKSNHSKAEVIALRAHDGPVIVAVNAHAALMNEHCWKYLQWFVARRKVMLVADESSYAANWSGQTRRLLTLGGWYGRDTSNVIVKAILDGTPVEESPLDIYYPSEFLQKNLLGYAEKTTFAARYCEYKGDEVMPDGTVVSHWTGKRFNRTKAARGDPDPYDYYPEFKRYCNLDELREKIFRFAMRVRWADVSDAPPKQYESLFFEMTDRQQRFYDRLADEYMADLASGPMPVREVLKRMTRMQMVARNYWPPERGAEPCDVCGGVGWSRINGEDCSECEGLGACVVWSDLERIDPNHNPAMEALLQRAAQVHGPFVVWCRFRQDAGDVLGALRAAHYNALPYWGDYPSRENEASYIAFRDGVDPHDVIVATIAGGPSQGKDLSRAEALFYFSNDFKARLRHQTEDRAEGLLKREPTAIIDLIAVGTRDADVVEALRTKRDLAALVMGDPWPWLESGLKHDQEH